MVSHSPCVVSVREHPRYKDAAIGYVQRSWPEVAPVVYEDCITHCIGSRRPLPQWYLLMEDDAVIGCAGLITNDFISRMDLYPWLCALYVDEGYRGNRYSELLLAKAAADAKQAGFTALYLCTGLVGFYEKFDYRRIGLGYHPWGEASPIYEKTLE